MICVVGVLKVARKTLPCIFFAFTDTSFDTQGEISMYWPPTIGLQGLGASKLTSGLEACLEVICVVGVLKVVFLLRILATFPVHLQALPLTCKVRSLCTIGPLL